MEKVHSEFYGKLKYLKVYYYNIVYAHMHNISSVPYYVTFHEKPTTMHTNDNVLIKVTISKCELLIDWGCGNSILKVLIV